MRLIRSRLELRVELHSDMKSVFRDLDSLDKRAVRGCPADSKPRRLKLGAKCIVVLKTMSVPLGYLRSPIAP